MQARSAYDRHAIQRRDRTSCLAGLRLVFTGIGRAFVQLLFQTLRLFLLGRDILFDWLHFVRCTVLPSLAYRFLVT